MSAGRPCQHYVRKPDALIHRLALSPAARQLIDRREDLAPDRDAIQVAVILQLIGPLGCAYRRIPPVLVDRQLSGAEDVGVVDQSVAFRFCRRASQTRSLASMSLAAPERPAALSMVASSALMSHRRRRVRFSWKAVGNVPAATSASNAPGDRPT